MRRLFPLDLALATRLVERRQALGWSQNRLALASGLSEAAVQKYETLRCPLPPHAREVIERALGDAEQSREQVVV